MEKTVDTSKRLYFSMAALPPEIWACILLLVPGEQLGRLKLTGSKWLWAQLRRPHSVKAINLGSDYLIFKAWPAFLNDFSTIDEYSITNYVGVWWSSWSPKLDMLPSTLRKLTLFGPQHEISSFFLRRDGSPFVFVDHLPHVEELYLNQPWDLMKPCMARFPPNLTKLSILNYLGGLALPASVTHLNIAKDNPMLGGWNVTYPGLPTGLRILNVSTMSLGPSTPLPPNLTSLKASKYLTPERNFQVKALPSALTSLGQFVIPRIEFDLNLVNLTKLNIAELCTQDWPLLPNTLKELILDTFDPPIVSTSCVDPVTGSTYNIDTYPLRSLPQKLERLVLTFKCAAYLADYNPTSEQPITSRISSHLFPPTLKSLELHNAQISPEAMKTLPTTLQSLQLTHFNESLCRLLPSGLTELKGGHTLVSPQLFQLLPKSLTLLHLIHASAETQLIDPRGEFAPSHRITAKFLPGFYEHSRFGSDQRASVSMQLPASLTRIALEGFTYLGDSLLLPAKEKLKILEMKGAKNFTDMAIPMLPRALTHLNLDFTSKVTGKNFPFLPTCLVYLNLRKSTDINDSDIQHLPRILQYLDIGSAIYLTNDSVPDFPKTLIELDLQKNTVITAHFRPILPSLQKITLRYDSCEFFTGRSLLIQNPQLK